MRDSCTNFTVEQFTLTFIAFLASNISPMVDLQLKKPLMMYLHFVILFLIFHNVNYHSQAHKCGLRLVHSTMAMHIVASFRE